MNVSRVGGKEGAKEEEDLAGAVGGGVEEGCARHFKGVLQARVSLWLLLSEGLKFADVVGWVAGHVAHADSETIPHADDAELGDGVLLEELGDEFLAVAEGEEITGGTEVLFSHGGRKVDDEDQMADDPSLGRSGILEASVRSGD